MDYKNELKIILKEIHENHSFGSLFQFWVSQAESEIRKHYNFEISDEESREIALKIISRIADNGR